MRWIFVTIVLILFTVAGLWSVNHYIKKDDYSVIRTAVEQRVSTVMGKQFRIHGEVSMAVALSPTVQFYDLRLANSEWARDEYLATIERFEVQLRLIPLLFGNYSVSLLRLDGFDLNLEIAQDGRINWQYETGGDAEPTEFDAVFRTIAAENFSLSIFDHRDGNEFTSILNSFTAKTDDSSDPIEIDAEGTVNKSLARVSGRIGSYDQLLHGTGSLLDLTAEYKDIRIKIDGSVAGPEPDGFLPGDLHISATGTDIMKLTDIYEFELFNTDKFSIDGHLLGTRAKMSVQNVDIFMQSGDNTLSIKGGTEDLFELSTFDIQAQITGSNLKQHYGSLIELDLPDSDSYDVKGHVTRANGVISLSDVVGEISDGPAKISVKGGIQNVEELLGFDLDYQVSGDNVEILESFSGIDLPPTDRFLLGGHLQGSITEMTASNLRFEVDIQELELKVNGSVENIVGGSGFDLQATAEGNDLGDIDALLQPFTDFSLRNSILIDPDLDESVTGKFVIKGHVTGSKDTLKLSDMHGSAIRDGIQITLNGSIGDLYGMENIDIRFTAEGPDISELNVIVPQELPDTGRYQTSGHITGTVPHVAITDFKGNLTLGSHKLSLQGDIGELTTQKGQNLVIKMSGGNIRDLESFAQTRFPPSQRYTASVNLVERDGDLDFRQLVFDGFRDSIEFRIRGHIDSVKKTPEFDLSVDFVGKEFGDGGVYWDMSFPAVGPFQFGATVKGDANRVTLKELHAKVGHSNFRGYATIVPGDRTQIVNAHISGQIDATPWIPEQEELQEKREERGRLFSEKKFDYTVLRNLDIDLTVDQLNITEGAALITIKNGSIQLKNGVLRVDPFDGQYQQAIIDMSLEIDASSTDPKFSMSLLSEGFDFGLYLDQADRQDQILGLVNFNIEAEGSGASMAEVASTANGEAYILFTHGFFPKQDLPLKITDFIFASFKWLGEKKDLVVECAMSYQTIENGILDQEILYVDSNQMVMGGFGEIDLDKEKYNLTVAPRPKKRRFLSSDLDVDIKGSLLEPRFSLNTASAAKSGAKHYGAFLALGPAGFLLPMSGRDRGMKCVGNISEFKAGIEAAAGG